MVGVLATPDRPYRWRCDGLSIVGYCYYSIEVHMRAYLIVSLKWAITAVLAYHIYSEGHTYTAIGLLWCMMWVETTGYIAGRAFSVCGIHTQTIGMLNDMLREIIEALSGSSSDKQDTNEE